jgi:hypothetical protein
LLNRLIGGILSTKRWQNTLHYFKYNLKQRSKGCPDQGAKVCIKKNLNYDDLVWLNLCCLLDTRRFILIIDGAVDWSAGTARFLNWLELIRFALKRTHSFRWKSLMGCIHDWQQLRFNTIINTWNTWRCCNAIWIWIWLKPVKFIQGYCRIYKSRSVWSVDNLYRGIAASTKVDQFGRWTWSISRCRQTYLTWELFIRIDEVQILLHCFKTGLKWSFSPLDGQSTRR